MARSATVTRITLTDPTLTVEQLLARAPSDHEIELVREGRVIARLTPTEAPRRRYDATRRGLYRGGL